MADKEVSPVFKRLVLGGGPSVGGKELYTRRGRGLMDEDTPTYLVPRLGETMHQREEPEPEYRKGGSVTRPGAASHGKLIRKYGG